MIWIDPITEEYVTEHYKKYSEAYRCFHCKQPMTLDELMEGKLTHIGGMTDTVVHSQCSTDHYARNLRTT